MRALLLLMLTAPPALAAGGIGRCHFDRECFEAEPCQVADFALVPRAGGANDAPITTEFGTFAVVWSAAPAAGAPRVDLLAGAEDTGTAGMVMLLSRAAEGAGPARLQVSMPAGDLAQTIAYLGHCEDAR